jgi:hypothetical protein
MPRHHKIDPALMPALKKRLRAPFAPPSAAQRQADARDKQVAGWFQTRWTAYAITPYDVCAQTAHNDWAVAREALQADAAEMMPTALEWHLQHRLDLILHLRATTGKRDTRLELAAAQDLAHLCNLYSADKAAMARAGLDATLGTKAKGDSQLAEILLAAYGTMGSVETTDNEPNDGDTK